MHQAEDRTENLGTGDLAARIDVIEYRWAHEVAALVTGDRCAAPIDKHFSALARAFSDQRLDALLALRCNNRPHLNRPIKPITDLAGSRYFCDPLSENVASLANRDGHRCRQAALAGAPEGRVGDDAGGHLHIGVW